MNGTALPTLFAVDCSDCGRPTVTSDLCERPDLCYPCFTAFLLAPEEGNPR